MAVLLLILAALAAPVAAAPPPESPAGDTFVRRTLPGDNFNGQDLSVAGSTLACNPTDVTYLQWDVSDVRDVESVVSATLTLRSRFASNTGSATLGLYAAGDGWSESSLTYSATLAIPTGTLLDSRPAPTTSAPTVTFSSAALVAYLDAEAVGDDTASFLLRLDSGCVAGVSLALFEDRESGTGGPLLQTVTEISAPDLVIHKAGPAAAQPGSSVTYTLVYSNSGNALASQVTISDALPAALLNPTVTFSGAPIVPRPGSSLVWDVSDLAPGAGGTITVTATVSPTFLGLLTNSAAIATTGVESDTLNNLAGPVFTSMQVPDLAIYKQGPAEVLSGEAITYTIAYSNSGSATALQVAVTDTLPAGLTDASFAYAGPTVTARAGVPFAWDVGDLVPGASGVITVTATVSPAFAGVLSNSARIATPLLENLDNNLSGPILTTVGQPDLAIRKAGPPEALPGSTITYCLTYSNAGTLPAYQVVISDVLPAALIDPGVRWTGAPITLRAGSCCVWDAGDLAPGAGGTITLSARLASGYAGSLANRADISGALREVTLDNNAGSAVTHVPYRLYLPLVMREGLPTR